MSQTFCIRSHRALYYLFFLDFMSYPQICSPPGSMVSVQCFTHTTSFLWTCLHTFPTIHKAFPLLSAYVMVHIRKIQFKFYLVSVVIPNYSSPMLSLYSEFLLFSALYSLAFSDRLSHRTGCPVYAMRYTGKQWGSTGNILGYTGQLNKDVYFRDCRE